MFKRTLSKNTNYIIEQVHKQTKKVRLHTYNNSIIPQLGVWGWNLPRNGSIFPRMPGWEIRITEYELHNNRWKPEERTDQWVV